MTLGAFDFLMEKPYAPAELLRGIEAALGSRSISPDRQARRREALALVERLSKRQRQVLEGIPRGDPNKVIAFDIGLGTRTVEAYRAQLLEKLRARDRGDRPDRDRGGAVRALKARPAVRRPARSALPPRGPDE